MWRRRIKLEGEIHCKVAERLERFVQGQNCKFVAEIIQLNTLHRFKFLTVYVNHSDSMKLDILYYITQTSKAQIRLITLSTREMIETEEFVDSGAS